MASYGYFFKFPSLFPFAPLIFSLLCLDLCIDGEIKNLVAENGVLYISGNYIECDTGITNFIVSYCKALFIMHFEKEKMYSNNTILNFQGTNSTIRTVFISGNMIYGIGRFGYFFLPTLSPSKFPNRQSGDEIREWDSATSSFEPSSLFRDTIFEGRILSVAQINSGETVVGGNFQGIWENGIFKNISHLAAFSTSVIFRFRFFSFTTFVFVVFINHRRMNGTNIVV